jgi:uncharacterized membrane protein (UPF0127 family)
LPLSPRSGLDKYRRKCERPEDFMRRLGEVNRVRLLIMLVVLIPLLLIAGSVLLYDFTPIGSSPNIHYTSFSTGNRTFKLTYLATNQSTLQKGLMNRKVTNDTTMLFVFPTEGYYSFWMYGVNSSLDMIWVSAPPGSNVGHVVYLALDAPPCHISIFCTSYEPTARANYVIEAKGGFADANGIKEGMMISFN